MDFKDLWQKREEGKITIPEMGKEMAGRIKVLQQSIELHSPLREYLNYPEPLEDIALSFETIDASQPEHEQISEFDGILSMLYDWGDQTVTPPNAHSWGAKMCWINTRF